MTTISGNVHNPATRGHETEGVVELLHPTNSRQCLYSAAINEHGAYSMHGIDAGSYLLFCSVWAADKQYFWEIPLTVKADESKVHIDLLADTAQTLDQI
jgi:hypothetical protein